MPKKINQANMEPLHTQQLPFMKKKVVSPRLESTADDNTANSDLLQATLCSKNGFQSLYEFARGEYSTENLELWKELNEICQNMDQYLNNSSLLSDKFTSIYHQFISDQSDQQVNLSDNVKKMFASQLEISDIASAQCVFHVLYGSVMRNISDTFSRFVDAVHDTHPI